MTGAQQRYSGGFCKDHVNVRFWTICIHATVNTLEKRRYKRAKTVRIMGKKHAGTFLLAQAGSRLHPRFQIWHFDVVQEFCSVQSLFNEPYALNESMRALHLFRLGVFVFRQIIEQPEFGSSGQLINIVAKGLL